MTSITNHSNIDNFTTEIITRLKQMSTEKQQETIRVVQNTCHSCVMTSLEKINQIYVDAKKHEAFKDKILNCKDINLDKLLKVQKHIVDKNYEDLYKALGHALPEINDKTFYHKFISQENKLRS